MADENAFDPSKPIPTLVGDLTVSPSDDNRFAIFQFSCHDGPIRIAMEPKDLPRLIATAAHAYTPEMPAFEATPKDHALPTAGWSIIPARDGSVAFSFQLTRGAALTFLVLAEQKQGLLEALQNALGMSDFSGSSAPKSVN